MKIKSFIGIVIISSVSQVLGGDSGTITNRVMIQSPRVLNDALILLQKRMGKVITFEDAPYVSDNRCEQLFPGASPIPRIQSIDFTYRSIEDDKSIINRLLQAYSMDDKTVRFHVDIDSEYENIFHIVPKGYLNASGQWVADTGFLAKNVDISPSDTETWSQIVSEICMKVSTSGTDLFPLGYGCSGYPSLPMKRSEKTARSYLTTLINDRNCLIDNNIISWSVRRGPPISSTNDIAILQLLSLAPQTERTKDVSMHIETSRPLLSALSLLSQSLNQSLIYEDFDYLCPCSILRDNEGNPQIPRGGIIDYSYNSKTNTTAIFNGCLQAFDKMNDIGAFDIRYLGNTIYVFPIIALDTNSVAQPQKAVLDTKVTFDIGTYTAEQIVEYLVEKLNGAANVDVSSSNLPKEFGDIQMHIQEQTSIAASQVLAKISGKSSRNLFWSLIFHPATHTYSLEVKEFSNQRMALTR